MSDIVVKVSDLLAKAQELSDAGMEYVSLTVLDEDEFDGEVIPASLHFDAIESDDSFMSIDFEEIDLISLDEDED